MSLGTGVQQQVRHEGGLIGSDPVRFGKTAEAFVLLILAMEPSYGYDIAHRLQAFGYEGAATERSLLYRLLRELQASGAIVSEWAIPESGPARRYYALTDAGRRQLRQGAERLARVKDNIERFQVAYADLEERSTRDHKSPSLAGSHASS